MDHGSNSQPDASVNEAGDQSSQQPEPSKNILNVILSEKFQQDFQARQNALPKDDPMRAEACFRIGGQFNLYYVKTASLTLLEHAIAYTKQAVENSIPSHNRLPTYVAIHSDLLRQKVAKTQTLEDSEAYLTGLRQGIQLLDEGNLKEEKKRELGCAYFDNYSQTKNIDRLELAIMILEECFTKGEKKYPHATIYLGAALLNHYQRTKQLDDLIRCMDLLQKGVEITRSDEIDYTQLRDFGLDYLLSAATIACSAPCGPQIRTQLINYLDLAVSSAPPDCPQVIQLNEYREALYESVKGPEEIAKLLFRLSQKCFLDWKSQGNVGLLDEAIAFAQEALTELPNGHDLIPEYARILVFVAQTKAITIQGPESAEQYVEAIKAAINATIQVKSTNDELIQRLAWAYWARFELSKSEKDLNNVIDYVNGLIDAHHDILPHTELILGQALHGRFNQSNDVDDIEKALNLFEEALQSPDAGKPVRDIMLQKLVQYSIDMLIKRPGAENLDRLIKNATFVIPKLPSSDAKEYIQSLVSKMRTYNELLSQRQLLDQVYESLSELKLHEKESAKPVGNTYAPQALYDMFKIGQAEFRTLELMPGKPDEEIVCKLDRAAFASNIEYEALSYTWGDPNKVSEITIGNSTCRITVNLALALKRLRRTDMSRILWVDAVCINQNDTQERSQQVAMMGEIYRRAHKVLTWLGEPCQIEDLETRQSARAPVVPDYTLPSIQWGNDEQDLSVVRELFTDEKQFDDWPLVGALSTLILLSKNCHLNTLSFFQDPRYPHFNIGIYPSDLWRKCCKALMELLSSPYWSRVWIVQEIVLGSQILLHHGRHIIPLDILFDAARLMRKHYYGCCYHHCAADTNNKWSNVFSILNGLDSIRDFENMKSSQGSRDITHLSNVLLAGMDFREATDARDQIYGLLGLVPGCQEDQLLRPDYSLPVGKTYTRAAFKIMRDSGNLQLLSYADRHRRVEDLPSWCHDFAEKGIFNPYPYDWEFFNACTATEFRIDLKADSILEVRGFHLDTITQVTDARAPESLSRSALSRWIEEGLSIAHKHCATENGVYRTDPPIHIEEAYARVLIGDTFSLADGSNRRATYEDVELFYGWLSWINENVGPETKDWAARQPPIIYSEIFTTFMARTQSRKIFATESKRLGMGISIVFGEEKEVSLGDQVWLLQGSRLPVILQPIPAQIHESEVAADTSSTSDSHYALISTAYIHGIMDGEASPPSSRFKNISLGHFPKPSISPIPANEPMRDALRTALLFGHGSGRNERLKSRLSPRENRKLEEGEAENQGVNAELLLFPEGRKWPEWMKPIPQHRVILAALFQNLPETEEGWEELESNMLESLRKQKVDMETVEEE